MTPERIAQLEQMLERGTIRKGHIWEMLDVIKQRKPLVWLSKEDERQIKDHCTTVACVLKAVKAKLKEKNT